MDEALRRAQHKSRMNHMPWLYFRAKPDDVGWTRDWQRELRDTLTVLERVELDDDCFIAETAHIFAEPGRTVRVEAYASIAAGAFIHGPVSLGEYASLNPSVVVKTVLENDDPNFGLNALTGDYGDLRAAGVIDPTKVSRTAFENAVSVSTLLLTTDCLVTEAPEEKVAAHDHEHHFD